MENNSQGGVGFLGLLAIAFIVLKLTEVIDWSWWWVTLPLWGGLAIALFIFAILLLLMLWDRTKETIDEKRRERKD